VQLYKLTISAIHEEIPGFKTLSFFPHPQLPYKAGQYLTFLVPTPSGPLRRSYSILSSPAIDDAITIGVKRIENGYYSRQLVDHAQPGDELITIGAGGFFLLPQEPEMFPQLVFFAAGSGITPVYALLRTLLHMHPLSKAVLIYSNPSPETTILYRELSELQNTFASRLNIHFLFSNNPDLKAARLNRELLPLLLQRYSKTNTPKNLYYICGPVAYMRLCLYTLQELGVPTAHIRREHFVIDRIAPARPAPPEKEPRKVHLLLGGEAFSFMVNPPETILQAAKKAGISLPYSCEVGRCGSCVADCIQGKVWLSYNEVLTEEELKKGLTLTCTGHPVGGDISLIVH